jgi:hypothetical protein
MPIKSTSNSWVTFESKLWTYDDTFNVRLAVMIVWPWSLRNDTSRIMLLLLYLRFEERSYSSAGCFVLFSIIDLLALQTVCRIIRSHPFVSLIPLNLSPSQIRFLLFLYCLVSHPVPTLFSIHTCCSPIMPRHWPMKAPQITWQTLRNPASFCYSPPDWWNNLSAN